MLAAVWNKGEVKLKTHTIGSLCTDAASPKKKSNFFVREGRGVCT